MAECPETSTFSVTVSLLDYQGKYLAFRRNTGWWHFDYPIVYKKPSAEYENVRIQFPHDKIDLKMIPK